ncbi:MAG TPA: type IV pilus assembly protein PilM [Myxococcales bacterium]|nr:type IV pilus assembly protein PilM [Myxococcales bacterium]HIN85506.1 type IV pilus assembly protein PilM [Myxococcales bacterium]
MARKKNTVGLDIGSSSIKLVQLKETPKGVELVNFDTAPLPHEAVVDGALMNFGAIVDKIQELWSVTKTRTRDIALSVSGHSVIIKKISLPEMTPAELEDSIQWEAEQYIPFDIKDVNVDVQILNAQAGQGQMDVLLVAAKKEVINDYTSVAIEAGLRPVVVDVDTFCIQNMFELNYGFPPNETIALLNVGASVININVVHDGITSFTRDISMGGSALTDEIMKQLSVSFEEAEHYKTGGDGNFSSSSIAREVSKLSERTSESLVTEIQRSLDFFAATTINADIGKIYLSGGASQLPHLLRALERRLEVPVEYVNPFRNITIDENRFNMELLNQEAPVAAVAVGLALRSSRDK